MSSKIVKLDSIEGQLIVKITLQKAAGDLEIRKALKAELTARETLIGIGQKLGYALQIPDKLKLIVHENSKEERHLVIPDDGDLGDDDDDHVR